MIGSTIIIHQKRSTAAVKLSLVALMDIFTILVFFLLLNSGESQTLEDAKFVKLPDSSAEKSPYSELVLHVGLDEVWLDNEKVVDVADISLSEDEPIVALSEALQNFVKKRGEQNLFEEEFGFSVTIMADQAVPYALLKSVMATCSGQDFRDISLAVNRVSAPIIDMSTGSPAPASESPSSVPTDAPQAVPTASIGQGGL